MNMQKKICSQMIIGWGGSALLTLILVLLDNLNLDATTLQQYQLPNIGVRGCFLAEEAQFLYFHVPTCVLLVFDLVCLLVILQTVAKSALKLYCERVKLLFQDQK